MKETNEMLPTIYGQRLPITSDETLDQLLRTAEQNTILVSVKKDGGFELKGTWFETLTGVICDISPYLVRWENREPDKLPYIKDELDWPEGYKPGADVTIVMAMTLFLHRWTESQ